MEIEREELIRKTKLADFAIKFDKISRRVIIVITALAFIFLLSAVLDMLNYSMRGVNGVKYTNFEKLTETNPHTVAWLKINNTKINHPVVQGKDNFEYLDKDFYGEYYSGGTLMLEEKNKKDFSDPYNIIHGHHMVNGAMFGDLEKFLKKDFFDSNEDGVLLTPKKNYRLKIFGVASVNAYDLRIYNVRFKDYLSYIKKTLKHKRAFDEKKQILALSTCTGDFNNTRTILFCTMEYDPELDYTLK